VGLGDVGETAVHAFEGTYGDDVLAKVGKVFPDLQRQVP